MECFIQLCLKVLKMYLHCLIDYHDKKYSGGLLLEAQTAPECLAIILPLKEMILTSAFNQRLQQSCLLGVCACLCLSSFPFTFHVVMEMQDACVQSFTSDSMYCMLHTAVMVMTSLVHQDNWVLEEDS